MCQERRRHLRWVPVVGPDRYDAPIRSWADQAGSFGKVVAVRLARETNGRWYPWGITDNGTTPQECVPA